MNKILKKWLPGLITIVIVFITIILLLNKEGLPTFKTENNNIDIAKVNEIIKMLENEDTKSNAQEKLDELYKKHTKDDNYYLAKSKIIMATGNAIDAINSLNYVKNKTEEYYKLRIKAAAGEFFTMGNVPNRLLETSIEASKTYSDNISFQILAGELYYDKDNYNAALYYLDKALQIDENNVDANYYYALCIYLLGDKEEGISYMTRAKNLYKGDDNEYKNSMENYINIMKEDKR